MKWMASFLSALLFCITSAAAREPTRTTVSFGLNYSPGTIVVVNRDKKLYLVLGDGTALRYDVAVGKPRAQWVDTQSVTRKAVNPSWTPTPNMRKKKPGLRSVKGGSPKNPLGARAIYLYGLYRIHGTNEPNSIGSAASSGCIRMLNADVIDLYSRVSIGAKVVVVDTLPGVNLAQN